MEEKINDLIPVKIVMVTYNQDKYIAQAIESVIEQKTNFNYKLIIGDDCSTDNTGEICSQYAKKYPDKIILISNKKNLGLLKNYKQIIENYPAKYIAILEGDDYWIDKNKLQIQYDLLENKPNIGLVHTDCDFLYESGKIQKGNIKWNTDSIKNGIVFEHLLLENYIRPGTVMFRQYLYDKYVSIDEYIKLGFKTLDYPMWLDIAFNSKFYYLKNTTAVYRVHNGSISNSNSHEKISSFSQSTYNIRKYALNKYKTNLAFRKSTLNDSLTNLISIEMEFKNYVAAKNLAKNLAIINLKSFIIRIIATNRHLIKIYSIYLKYRKTQLWS